MNFYFTGNYTTNFIAKEYKKYSKYNTDVGEYCQYFQDIIFSDSFYNQKEYDFTLVFLDGSELVSSLKNIKEIKGHIEDIVQKFLENRRKGYLIFSNVHINTDVNSLWNYNQSENNKKLQSEINLFLNELAVKHDRFFVLDILSIIEEFGVKNLYDFSTWIYGKNRFNKKGLKLLSLEILYLVNSILSKRKKCLVLDLDNTLWGGIIGEDGINGIQLSSDGVGDIYKKFQEEILKIKNKGIILAICSKNNQEDAKEVFDNHPFMILKWNDFIIHKVNWDLKSQNIQSIAKELNIGEDSLVFIDDNPMERKIAKEQTSCIVPEFPDDIFNLLNFITDVGKKYFSIQNILDEDINKTNQYKENIQRNDFERSFKNYVDFVSSLSVSLTIFKNNNEHINRVAQMTQKTNQFNFTTKRYSTEDIKFFVDNKDYDVYTGHVIDRFGDFGVVILAIAKIEKNQIVFDTFLMSCRVIGKLVEDKFLEFISKDCKKQKIVLEYFKTKKNVLIESRLEKMGFNPKQIKDDYKLYSIDTPIEVDNNLKLEVNYE